MLKQQAQIRQRLQPWNRLTPQRQQALRDRQHIWEQMTPEQCRYVQRSLFPRCRQWPPARSQAIFQRRHSLRELREADRQAKLNHPGFARDLDPEDREMLVELARSHVGMAPASPVMQPSDQKIPMKSRLVGSKTRTAAEESASRNSYATITRECSGKRILIVDKMIRACTICSGF